jgi:glycosyltransferase involved in cell wall biosynthesis
VPGDRRQLIVVTQPLVSIVIPAYNAAATIARAIDSALAQTHKTFEIIVIDDGSRDLTSEIVSAYRCDKIQLLRLARNQGESGAMNEGIAIAKGEYIAFLDADDEWKPTKLAKQVEALQNNPRATMATCGCHFVDGSGELRLEFGMPPPDFTKNEIWRSLLAATCIAKPCVTARASALRAVGPFDTSLMVAADQDMWIRLAMNGEVEFVREYLTVAHDTPGSLTKVYARKSDRFVLSMIARHLERRRRELSRNEIRRILGRRYTQLGRNLYRSGARVRGAAHMLHAMLLGNEVRENLWYFVTATGPANVLKELVGYSGRKMRRSERRAAQIGAVGGLLTPDKSALANRPAGPPVLIVVIDSEAEFDWSGPFLRTHTGVQNLRRQFSAQQIFDRFGVRPIYLVDYAVATQREGYEPLRELLLSDRCEIGAHLQAWETPPFAEELGEVTSFNHNLPAWLQKEKLSRLTEAIVSSFGIQPLSYRAGRYGVGEEIAWILDASGYEIDLSVLPGIDLRWRHGPDFRRAFTQPYWFGRNGKLLEIPLTTGFAGLLATDDEPQTTSASIYKVLAQPGMSRIHAPGAFARLGLLERIALTPEGVSIEGLKRLTRVLLARGNRVFTFSYHSSSLLPGNTPYVRSQEDLDRMLRTIEDYLRFFIEEIGGTPMRPSEFRAGLLPKSAP